MMTGPRERLPFHELLDALEAWERDPSPANRRAVGRALGRMAAANGALGARLELDAPPLPRLQAACGTVRRRPGASSRLFRRALSVGGEQPLGTLWLDLPADRSAEDARLPPLAARAIETALDAAWSRARTRAVVRQLEALDEATRGIAGVLAVDRVLQLIVDLVRELAHCRYAALATVNDDGSIDHFVTSGLTRREAEAIGAPPRGRGLLGALIREGRLINIDELAGDPRAFGFPPHHPPMHSFLGVPLTVKGRNVGNLYLTDKIGDTRFGHDDEKLVVMFALHAAIAIDNARLHEQVQRLAVLEERQRISKDLHDGTIQSIYAVGLALENVPDVLDENPDEARTVVERAIEALNLTIRDIRNFIFGLRPELLEGAEIGEGLRALAEEFRINTLVDIEVEAPPGGVELLRPEQTAQLLQVTREALSNVARHARATRASIRLEVSPEAVHLSIADNGTGFDLRAEAAPGHQGLRNIAERTQDLGGVMEIDSAPGRGTTLRFRLPRLVPAARPSGRATV
ncbi:MAG: hypothetical protein A2X23_06655 [Chloroflexi bacterium GWC2_73_18]|nr:MAG: hypothetical protein A2X23_06655 [Chloroflexi bacterium GWC2_73_18]